MWREGESCQRYNQYETLLLALYAMGPGINPTNVSPLLELLLTGEELGLIMMMR